jgi:ATPase subunit of ABC transporter with duplicated ATPase domains
MVQARLKLMEKMVELEAPDDEKKFAFKFPEPAPLRKETLIQLEDVTFSYNEKRIGSEQALLRGDAPLLNKVSLYVDVHSRIGGTVFSQTMFFILFE